MVIIIAAEMFDWLVMRQGNGISATEVCRDYKRVQ